MSLLRLVIGLIERETAAVAARWRQSHCCVAALLVMAGGRLIRGWWHLGGIDTASSAGFVLWRATQFRLRWRQQAFRHSPVQASPLLSAMFVDQLAVNRGFCWAGSAPEQHCARHFFQPSPPHWRSLYAVHHTDPTGRSRSLRGPGARDGCSPTCRRNCRHRHRHGVAGAGAGAAAGGSCHGSTAG